MYILDTDHISLLESASSSPEAQRLRFRLNRIKGPDERITTIITFEEQMRGWMSFLAQACPLTQQVAAYGRLKGVLDRYLKIIVLEFDEAAATEFERLRRLRLRVGLGQFCENGAWFRKTTGTEKLNKVLESSLSEIQQEPVIFYRCDADIRPMYNRGSPLVDSQNFLRHVVIIRICCPPCNWANASLRNSTTPRAVPQLPLRNQPCNTNCASANTANSG